MVQLPAPVRADYSICGKTDTYSLRSIVLREFGFVWPFRLSQGLTILTADPAPPLGQKITGGDLTGRACGPGTLRLAGLHGRPRLGETPRPRGGLPAPLADPPVPRPTARSTHLYNLPPDRPKLVGQRHALPVRSHTGKRTCPCHTTQPAAGGRTGGRPGNLRRGIRMICGHTNRSSRHLRLARIGHHCLDPSASAVGLGGLVKAADLLSPRTPPGVDGARRNSSASK